MGRRRRIGIVGFGLIGEYVYQQVKAHPQLDVAFVFDTDLNRTAALPQDILLERAEDFGATQVDMVCELAHPEVSRRYGKMFLSKADYFLLSVTALADANLEHELLETARQSGHTLFVPHGGVVGLDAIVEGRDSWTKVNIEMSKHPRNLDFSAAGVDESSVTGRMVLYDGPTRDVCPLFPRNVNTHATLALAGIGFDRTHSTLIADPKLDQAIVRITAESETVHLALDRSEGITGVSGASTPWSVFRSVASTANAVPGLQFC